MKSKTKKVLKRLGISLLLLLMSFIILQRVEFFESAFLNMSFRYSDQKMMEKLASEPLFPKIQYTSYLDFKIRYVKLSVNPNFPWVVFIHGAPGSSADYLDFFKNEKLTTNVNLISVDRLGYGYSDYGSFEVSLDTQARAIHQIIQEACTNEYIIIVGHSYGGPIALQLAMQTHLQSASLILLAPAIDPDHEKEISLASLGIIPWTRWLITPAWQVASAEKINHVEELRKLESLLNQVSIPVCHIHGTRDSLVPYENLAYSIKKIKPELLECVTLEGVDHFLPWSHHDLVVEKILEYCHQQK